MNILIEAKTTPQDYKFSALFVDLRPLANSFLLTYLFEPTSPRENHGDVSWVVNTLRSPVPASLRLEALQLKPSLPGLRALEYPLFTHYPF